MSQTNETKNPDGGDDTLPPVDSAAMEAPAPGPQARPTAGAGAPEVVNVADVGGGSSDVHLSILIGSQTAPRLSYCKELQL